MTGRSLACLGATFLLAACGRSTSEEPFLTPPPSIAAPEAPAPAAGGTPVPANPVPAPAAPAAPAPAPAQDQIHAAHLLVMYQGSMRAPATITRTKAEALARAQQALGRARRGDDFGALAREYSDDQSNREAGGDLGAFGRGVMTPAFETAAFALQPGQVSEIVETPFGYHVIKRTQ